MIVMSNNRNSVNVKSEEDILINDELIARYLSGEATPDEAMALHTWMEKPDNEAHFQELQNAWDNVSQAFKRSIPDREKAWKKVTEHSQEEHTKKTIVVFLSTPLKIAASFAVVLLTSIGIFLSLDKHEIALTHLTTKDSLRAIELSDHSQVVMSRNTTIAFPEKFNDEKKREMMFQSGEAFFRITPDRTKPFIIHSSVGDIQVVGTAFNVVGDAHHISVSVTEGKVLITKGSNKRFLEPGMTGEIKADTASIVVNNYSNGNAWGYATRKFVFKDTPLKHVIECLEKAYPCSISFQTEDIGNCKLNASFDNVSAEYMLNLIAESLSLTLTKNGNAFIMEGKGCP